MRIVKRMFCGVIVCGLLLMSGALKADDKDPKKEPEKKPAKIEAADKEKTPKEEKENKTKIEITLDTSAAPEMADYAEKSKKACEDNLALILKQIGGKAVKSPLKVKIVFKKLGGPAETSGSTISCSNKWFTDHPDDMGAVIHELCHVVQGYNKKQPPSWVTEGIADYVRWFQYEPKDHRPHVGNPDKAKYTDSYQTTAAFFNWIVENKDARFIWKLNSACRQGKYDENLFKKYTDKSVDDLWAEFVESLKKK
jgi:hypothetical protein